MYAIRSYYDRRGLGGGRGELRRPGAGDRVAGGEPGGGERSKSAVPFGGRYRIVDFVLSNLVNSEVYSIYLV